MVTDGNAKVLRSELTYLLLLSTAIMAGIAVVSFLTYRALFDSWLESSRSLMDGAIIASSSALKSELSKSEDLLQLLVSNPVSSQSLDSTRSGSPEQLDAVFRRYALAIDNIMQIRWLDESGVEKVRLDRRQNDLLIVEKEDLQDKSNRYYVADALPLPTGSLYVSELDLNVERGVVEVPHRPTLRVAIKTGPEQGLRAGMFIINYDFSRIISAMADEISASIHLQLVNHQGYWLYHPGGKLAWGHLLNRPEDTVAIRNPGLWRDMQDTIEDGVVYLKQHHVAVYQLYLMDSAASEQRSLYLVSRLAPGMVDRLRLNALITAVVLGVLLAVFTGFLLRKNYYLTALLSDRNSQLRHEKQHLAQSNAELDEALQTQNKLQRELFEAEKLASLGTMMAGISHEMNTPIGTAILLISTLQQRLQDFRRRVSEGLTRSEFDDFLEKSEAGLAQVLDSNQRAANLIAGFKRLAFDRSQDECSTFKLAAVINDVVMAMSPVFRKASVEVRVQVSDTLEVVSISGVLSQVVQNLMTNAIDHGLKGIADPVITVSAVEVNDQVEISVRDNGHGIEPDIVQHMFDPFVTSNRGEGNTGMGLYFVHQWVTKRLSGTVSAGPATGGGTTFVCRIPRVLQ